ncbi:unnamed protein product [Calicophoron daubneyi]|uniref:SANT domain-containing protein n=1 Tax=Calicophoron daubneyi TaxID=300641 RepID=A0AAV2TIW2_CALDB
MGEIYSKPVSNPSQNQGSLNATGSQPPRPRDVTLSGNHNTGIEQLSSAALDALSRLQGVAQPGPQVTPTALPGGTRNLGSGDQLFNSSSLPRVPRNQDLTTGNPALHPRTLTPEEMFAAAQLCGQLNSPQLNALVAAYQQQQQQLQRASGNGAGQHVSGIPFAQALTSVTSVSKSSPSSTFSLGVISGTNGSSVGGASVSHVSRPMPAHLVQSTPSRQHGQKRPSSGQAQYQSNHSLQVNANASINRPPSASQPLSQQGRRTPLQGQAVFTHGHSSHHLTGNTHLDSSAGNLIGAHNTLPVVCRAPSSHHAVSTHVASPSPSPGPTSNYQGRRPQLAPPAAYPNKRPRMTGTAQQQHNLPACHAVSTTIAAGMEALINSAVANKAIAGLNSGAYASATEAAAAAAAALTPLFSAAMNNSALSNSSVIPSSSSPVNANSYQSQLPVHYQRPPSATSNVVSGTAHSLNHHHQQQQQQQQQHLVSSSGSSYPNSLVTPLPVSLLNPLSTSRPNYSHAQTTTPPLSAPLGGSNYASQQNTSHASSTHVPSKANQSTPLLQMTSRLPSGHLHHTPHTFQSPPHGGSQPNAPHHVAGHANLPQGSGVLRQQTKEPAYHPQVEAISPAPEESRLADVQDAKIHREREEINRQLAIVDADIKKQEAHLRNLCERETRLARRLASASGQGAEEADGKSAASPIPGGHSPKSDADRVNDLERTFENPIQTFISENRCRNRQHHLIFTRLCGPTVKASPYALPLYRQPSDLASLRAIRSDFHQQFRGKLIRYLRSRRRAEESRIRFLAQQYAHHSVIFTKKVDKLFNSSKRRQRDARHRDIFEKVMPEVKKSREEREVNHGSECPRTRTSEVVEEIPVAVNNVESGQTTPYDPVEEMNKMKEYAIDPPICLAPWERKYRFICQAGLVTDCRAQLQEEQDLSKWSEEEKHTFKERYLATPKNFPNIASFLEGKTVAECIHYYYLSKKKENYKQLLKKHSVRRRRAAQSDRNGGGSGHGGGGVSVPPGSGSHSNGVHSPAHDTGHGSGDSKGSDATGSSGKESESKNTHRRETGNGRSRSNRGRSTGHGRGHNAHQSHSSHDTLHSVKVSTANSEKADLEQIVMQPTSCSSASTVATKFESIREEQAGSTAADEKKDFVRSGVLHSESSKNEVEPSSNHVTDVGTVTAEITIAGAALSVSEPAMSAPQIALSSSSSATTGLSAESGPVVSSSVPNSTSELETSGGSSGIKGLIYFAIEKNLAQPRSRDGPSEADWDRSASPCRPTVVPPTTTDASNASSSISNARPEITGHSPSPHSSSKVAALDNTKPSPGYPECSSHKPGGAQTSGGSTQQISVHRKSPQRLAVDTPANSSTLNVPAIEGRKSSDLFGSAPAADIYAAAARFAAATAGSTGLPDDMTTMYVAAATAAAVATAAVTAGSADRDPIELDPDACYLPKPMPHLSKLQGFRSQHPGGRDDEKRWANASGSDWNAGQAVDPSSSSKAILFGDFLTAQQLGRNASTVGSIAGRTAYMNTHAIDPDTLPVPVGPRPRRPEPHALAAGSSFPKEDPSSTSLYAENAAWLAIQAQAAAAAAAVRSSSPRPSLDEVAKSGVNSAPRCAYSPLSPSPLKKRSQGLSVAANSDSPNMSPSLRDATVDGHSPFSRLKRPYPSYPSFDLTLDESPSNSSLLDPRFRRRGYTESQINLRIPSKYPLDSSNTGVLAEENLPVKSSAPVSSGSSTSGIATSMVKEKPDTIGYPPLNTANYIDALIHSHLNRNTRGPDDPASSTPHSTSLPEIPVPQFVADSVKQNKSAVADISLSDILPHSRDLNPDISETTSNLSTPGNISQAEKKMETPVKHVLDSTGANTLEEQINKAIAEEIRAQIGSRASENAIPSQSALHTFATTTGPHIESHGIPMNVPLKKRDRGSSLTVNQSSLVDSDLRHNRSRSETADCSRVLALGTADQRPNEGNESAMSAKLISVPRANGTRVQFELNTRLNLDPRLQRGKFSATNLSSPDTNGDGTRPRSNRCGSDSDLAMTYSNKTSILTTGRSGQDLELDRCEIRSPCSPCDPDSPGQLQIDLAAPDCSPAEEPNKGRNSVRQNARDELSSNTSDHRVAVTTVGDCKNSNEDRSSSCSSINHKLDNH